MPPYRTPAAAIRADVEWKLAILTVPRRVVLGAPLREELARLEKEAAGEEPGVWPELAKVCERALEESAKRLTAPKDEVTSLLRDDDPARWQLFVAVPNAVPTVDVGRSGPHPDDRFISEGHAVLGRWLLDAELENALEAIAELEPRIGIGDGDAYISWIASDIDPDPALPAVTRILLSVRDRLVVR